MRCPMRDYSDGVEIGVNEDDYQTALREYRDGIVVNLTIGRTGKFTRHKANCGTLSYNLATKKSPTPQTHRAGKILFHDEAELDDWLKTRADVRSKGSNRCSRCLGTS